MGMYSYYVDSDVRVCDAKKLLEVRSCLHWFKDDDNEEVFINDSGEIDWSFLNDWKIEGYWYEEVVNDFFRLAECIEGWVEFNYEEGYNWRLIFKDGGVFYNKGNIVFSEDEKSWDDLARLRKKKGSSMLRTMARANKVDLE